MRFVQGSIASLLLAANCNAALFLGPATFTTAPWSQFGTVTNNLTITNTANGFVVSGQAIVNGTPANPSGLVVRWTVERPLDPLYAGPFTLNTSTVLTGFSQPPPGTFLPSLGGVKSLFTNVGVPSESFVQMSLINGLDIPPWNGLSNISSTFTYTPSTGTLRQDFDLDFLGYSGPGGTWIIDVPVETSVLGLSAVPEPSTMVLAAMELSSIAAAKRFRRNAS